MNTDRDPSTPSRWLLNPGAATYRANPVDGRRVREFHRRLPGYRPTPCWPLVETARRLGVREVWLKDESSRLGLPAFKILGASWATCVTLAAEAGLAEDDWETIEDLRGAFAHGGPRQLVTATDGNHGRAVARVAHWLGLGAHIFVPAGTAASRIAAITSEGAEVTVVDGSYDDAVAAAARHGASPGRLIVSDTSWEGYTEIPSRVIDGYLTLFAEAATELALAGTGPPDLVIVQTGVGALAAAAVRAFKTGPGRTRIVNVEPEDADCVLRSAEAGHPVSVPGPHRSVMAGLNCGTPSLVAWPDLAAGVDCYAAIPDRYALEAMRHLADAGIVSGETGSAGLAALIALVEEESAAAARQALAVGPSTRVLVISTEGATDPVAYERIVGRTPEMVGRLRHPLAHG